MILLIDNYDSFTYNLYQAIGEMYEPILVVRNDEISISEIESLAPAAIVISPGPGYPSSAGISIDVINEFAGKIPILGICLGHQAIGQAFGGKIVPAKVAIHGKTSTIAIDAASPLFAGMPEAITVARYHSLVVDDKMLPEELEVISKTEDGEIMAIAHKTYPVYGLQFHPESFMTKYGKRILRNFVTGIAELPVKSEGDSEVPIPASERNVLRPMIQKVIDARDLDQKEAETAMECIMDGAATDAQIGSFLTALRMKGETVDEITGFASAMRKKAGVVYAEKAVDIVGTGGDMANTFNISTTAAFVVAGAGVTVAKHGNRNVSSQSGSADVLEALGVKIDLSPSRAQSCLKELSLAFLFAPCFHKSMKFAAAPRKEIGVRSVFNILGPLSNPAFAEYIVLGVYDEKLMEVMAMVLKNLGISCALVVHGEDGLDEITTTGITKICEVRDGKLIKYEITPEEFGIKRVEKKELEGGAAEKNAEIARSVLAGEKGPKRDIVLLNAAAAIYSAQKASSIAEALKLAEKSIDSGAAMCKLQELIACTNQGGLAYDLGTNN
ncbi:MAG: bifunctional anthranilate synthase component II/anthranilate phosphoribosyltransferase [Eubacteriales bacterium]|nr:bifunctional anthranilate synthase component II/anthranilate phosphoribosyltransferase [Eubacteriales bacterium]MDD3349872.1 bifunctional anthranilate synthase component II/anthranilate phosphoribosyltransferase [Eubacteriales bacterium]